MELLLPNEELTSLDNPGIISFDIPEANFLGPHGPLDPISNPKKKRAGVPAHSSWDDSPEHSSSPIYGPPRYYFDQHVGAIPPGPLRDAHEQIGKLQRWNKAQDRTIFKLKTKYKELKKTVKQQAKASAQFMKKVGDLLVKGGVGGCSSADFIQQATSAPQPQPHHPHGDPSLELGFPLSERQLQRLKRNPIAPTSNSGNCSPSLASSSDGNGEDVESNPHWNYHTTFPDEDEAFASHQYP